jgi:gamma-glutamylcyclotransferase (GGCT)/AIG2-like uncharacterized protein YtfP
MKKYYVFVYGTLRKHESNHYLLKGAELIARQCWTGGKLYDSHCGYPFLAKVQSSRVYGELYQVNDTQMKALDHLEGYHGPEKSNLYDRSLQKVYTDKGIYQAYVYVLPKGEEVMRMVEIKSGDWVIEKLQKQQSLFYFAYGSCMDTKRFEEAGVSRFFQNVKGRGILPGYQLAFTRKSRDGGRADIVEKGGTVEGKVYEIPKAALEYLYRREGVNAGCYRPALIDIGFNDTILKNVLTFVVINKEEETSPPMHYVNEILQGGTGLLSDSYMEKVKTNLRNNFNIHV